MSIGLEDADCPRSAEAIGMEEDHDVADGLLLGPAGGDLSRAKFADAGEFPQLLRARLDDLEGATPKAAAILSASLGPMPRTMPEPRYFSISSAAVGGAVFRKSALNCSP